MKPQIETVYTRSGATVFAAAGWRVAVTASAGVWWIDARRGRRSLSLGRFYRSRARAVSVARSWLEAKALEAARLA